MDLQRTLYVALSVMTKIVIILMIHMKITAASDIRKTVVEDRHKAQHMQAVGVVRKTVIQ